MPDTKTFDHTRWCRHLEEQLLDCYPEIAKGMASTMSLQNPPGATTPGIYFSSSWGSAPDPEVCLTDSWKVWEWPYFEDHPLSSVPLTAGTSPVRSAQKESRPLPTGSYDTSQPVVDGVTKLCYPGAAENLLLNPNVFAPFPHP